jgi:hypothetical protein
MLAQAARCDSEGLCMSPHEGLRSSERLRRRVAVEADSGRVVSRLERVLSRSRQLERRRAFIALALASLPCQTSTCLMLNVVGAVPQPAKQAQHVSIGRMVAAEPSAPVQVRAAEQCFSVGLPLILPCDAQKLLDSGSGDALMRDVHLVEAVAIRLLPISSTRAPARSHGVSLWLWLCSPVGSASLPELQPLKCLGRSRVRASARSHAMSLWLWCCCSLRSAMSPELQVHEPWADLVSFSVGEITRRFSLALASLPCQTRNVAGAVPEPAKQSCIHMAKGSCGSCCACAGESGAAVLALLGSPLMLPRDALGPWRCFHARRPLAGF